MDINDKKYEGLIIALNLLLKVKKGDKIGFKIGQKHFVITRDK